MRNRGWLFTSYDWTRSFHVPAGNSIHGDKDRHLPCTFAALRLEQMPDIILFRDCILHSFSYCLIVVLDRTVPDFYIVSLRCSTSNSRVAGRCTTGDGCPHLTTEHGHPMPRTGFQSTEIKTVICPAPPLLYGLNKCRTLSCSGIALSFLFSFCHFLVSPDFSLWCRSVKSGIFDFNVVLSLSCISGRPFSSDAYLSLVGQL